MIQGSHGQTGLLTESLLIQDISYWMFTTWAVFSIIPLSDFKGTPVITLIQCSIYTPTH